MKHLEYAPITPEEALKEYGSFRLAAHIEVLRKQGHDISTKMVREDGKEYGPAAWEGIQRQVIEMRKEAARQAAQELKEQEENRKDLIMVSSLVGFLVLAIAAIGIFLMFTVK